MATENQNGQDAATLGRIMDTTEKCWVDLQPYIGECANCGGMEHDAVVLSQVATLLQIAGSNIHCITWMPEDRAAEAEQAQDASPQDSVSLQPLDAIHDEIWRCWQELSEYSERVGDGLEETDAWRLQAAVNLLDVAEDRIEYVTWTQSPEVRQAHAEHSQQ